MPLTANTSGVASVTQGCMVLEELERIIDERARLKPRGSYTVSLLEAGVEYIARKVGEEAIEVVVAALVEEPRRLAEEVADLVYHLTVLLYARGLAWSDVFKVLEERRKLRAKRGEAAHSGPG